MSFEEKSTWVMLLTVTGVYSWYFLTILPAWSAAGEAAVADYRALMLGTVLVLVVVAIVAHIVIAVAAPDESDLIDERDRSIDRYGEYIGGYLAGAAALTGMGMAMYELPHFLIANVILLGLVISEIVTGLVKIYCYRRGF